MDTWQEIDSLGFYPALVARSLRRALGGGEPLASVCQLDAAFDSTSMFRHLTVSALTGTHLVQIHVDEMEDGGAMVATTLVPVGRIQGVSVVEVIADPTVPGGGSPAEVSLSLNVGGQRRGEVEPLQCEDPNCVIDHGYSMTSVPDDLTVRFAAAADGTGALGRAERFVDVLTSLLGAARG
ncbi:DUF5998 family protein [Schaalia naturae]|jgi:hypothetical protein|uniref:DUF5998 family protein n=1 Tax=Schaalia naturae TaxID=635203 RepID=A0ABW2SJM6_9ACTO